MDANVDNLIDKLIEWKTDLDMLDVELWTKDSLNNKYIIQFDIFYPDNGVGLDTFNIESFNEFIKNMELNIKCTFIFQNLDGGVEALTYNKSNFIWKQMSGTHYEYDSGIAISHDETRLAIFTKLKEMSLKIIKFKSDPMTHTKGFYYG